MSEIAGKDRRALRALGHHLKPVVQIGQQGITVGVLDATMQALDDHELIKVKVLESCPLDRHEAATQLAEETGAELAQVLGRTFLLYKPNPKEPKIQLGQPPKAALHGHIGGEGDRPAAGKPKRAISQGAGDERPAGRRGAASASKPKRRVGTGVPLPPRRR